MNRGSLSVDARKASDAAGFNEAPIHESGKFGGGGAIPRRHQQLQ